MPLRGEERAAVQTIAEFLAASDSFVHDPWPPDGWILMGNECLGVARALATTVLPHQWVIVSGGRGHSTEILFRALRTAGFDGDWKSEADALADYLGHLGVASHQVWRETASTNSGENLRRSVELARANGLPMGRVGLAQGPLLMRRALLTAQVELGPGVVTHRLSVPVLVADEGPWQPPELGEARFVELVLGEIPRLRNDAGGYGPNGRGFLAACDIPSEVEAAYARLTRVGFGSRGTGPTP